MLKNRKNECSERTEAKRRERTAAEEDLVKHGEEARCSAMANRGQGATSASLSGPEDSSTGGLPEPSRALGRVRSTDVEDTELVAVLKSARRKFRRESSRRERASLHMTRR